MWESIPYNHFYGKLDELKKIVDDKKVGRIGSFHLPLSIPVAMGLEDIGGRGVFFSKYYKDFIMKAAQNQLVSQTDEQHFMENHHVLSIENGTAFYKFEDDPNIKLNLNWPMLLSANLTHIITTKEIPELKRISNQVTVIPRAKNPLANMQLIDRAWRAFTPVAFYVYSLRNTFDRAFVVDAVRVLPNYEQVLETISVQSVETLRKTVFFSAEDYSVNSQNSNMQLRSGGKQPEASIRYYAPDKIILEVESKKPAILIIANNYDSRWRASVNGVASSIYRANYAFQSVFIQKTVTGQSEVVFTFHDPFLWGSHIFVLLGVCLILFGNHVYEIRLFWQKH